jgi:hypothetical protein
MERSVSLYYGLNEDGTFYAVDHLNQEQMETWVDWWSRHDNRLIKRDVIDTAETEVMISTVFLGIDHSFEPETPILFETMVFGSDMDGLQHRYKTREDALEGHERTVQLVRVHLQTR